ncbi:DUF4013 domain-containing protein [Halogeometricum luteum]|uniref:DUF4013 domain-containing protein n=1 Tax=Halogeometricum luteum TaxID=2950537 RepID=A0ABU2G218_9EURY|nr:DUF4013 domain-containing protein [Halogeometricum sp. S3BR5-2]MDS0294830.1 DUF4013 domain-containing protein [Halogeometricum sp. S3BR5-2]
MISESLTYLRNDEEGWIRTVLIGGILSLLGFLVVPTILVAGYLVRVVRATMRGDEQPPVFDEWGDMAVDGLKAAAIALVYGLVPMVVAGVLVAGSLFTIFVGQGSNGANVLGGLGFLAGLLVSVVLGLLAAYVIPAAVANFVETDRVGKAFSFGDLRPVLTSGKYFTAWISGFAVIFVAGIVAGMLSGILPFIGAIPGAFLGFYAAVAAYYMIGHAWGDLRNIEMREMGEQPDEQAVI